MMDTEAILRAVPIFSRLKGRQLARLARLATHKSFAEGTLILRRGDTGVALYIVVSGRVAARLPSEDAKPDRLLGEMGPGEAFGEMALIDDSPRSADVAAVEPTECLVLTRWDFSGEMKRDPEIAQALLPVLCRRIRELNERLSAYETPAAE
jgi:CRP-like cAMP-binding protein